MSNLKDSINDIAQGLYKAEIDIKTLRELTDDESYLL